MCRYNMKIWLKIGVVAAIIALLLFPIAALGYRFGLWDLHIAFKLLLAQVIFASIVVIYGIVSLIKIFQKPSPATISISLAILLLGALPILFLGYQYHKGKSLPAIHDITTDWQQPPSFQVILKNRPEGSNSLQYAGADVAKLQLEAYPKVKPIMTSLAPNEAFMAVLALIKQNGWALIDANKELGKIEAVDTSFWFGFEDDIVFRIEATPSGSRIDIRSVSRVGRSDFGVNAARIQRFTNQFKRQFSYNAKATLERAQRFA